MAAADILRSCPPGEYFFAGNREPSKPYSTFSHGKAALNRRTNAGKWRLHDLRHSAQTIMEEAGVFPHVVDRVLNHSTPGMGGRYGHHNWIAEKLDALEKLADLIAKIVEDSATA